MPAPLREQREQAGVEAAGEVEPRAARRGSGRRTPPSPRSAQAAAQAVEVEFADLGVDGRPPVGARVGCRPGVKTSASRRPQPLDSLPGGEPPELVAGAQEALEAEPRGARPQVLGEDQRRGREVGQLAGARRCRAASSPAGRWRRQRLAGGVEPRPARTARRAAERGLRRGRGRRAARPRRSSPRPRGSTPDQRRLGRSRPRTGGPAGARRRCEKGAGAAQRARPRGDELRRRRPAGNGHARRSPAGRPWLAPQTNSRRAQPPTASRRGADLQRAEVDGAGFEHARLAVLHDPRRVGAVAVASRPWSASSSLVSLPKKLTGWPLIHISTQPSLAKRSCRRTVTQLPLTSGIDQGTSQS